MMKTVLDPREREANPLVFPVEIKSVSWNDRIFESLLSTWDEDLGGDIVHKGAFRRTLDHWRESGRVIPLVDNHAYRLKMSPSFRDIYGKLVDAEETDAGLLTKWRVVPGNDGDEALHRIEDGAVDQMSMGYKAVRFEFEDVEGQSSGSKRVRHLYEVKLGEGSLVIFAMNPNARIDAASVKSFVEDFHGRDDLTDTELKALEDVLEDLRALVDGEKSRRGLAPDDPRRLEVEAMVREVTIGGLAARV